MSTPNTITKPAAAPLPNPLEITPDALGFVPQNAGRSTRSRLNIYVQWLADTGGNLLQPDFAAFAHYLETGRGLTSKSAAAYVTTVRARYKKHILKSNAVDELIERGARASGWETPGDVRALVERTKTRLANALDAVTVRQPKKEVKTDADKGRWLSDGDVSALLSAPDRETLEGLRDYTIFLLMLFTGLRAAELCNLRCRDVWETLTDPDTGDAQPVLKVTDGKGAKQRIIPYGGNAAAILGAVRRWQQSAAIQDGFLFRGFTAAGAAKDNPTAADLRDSRMATRTLNYIFDRYPVGRDPVNPHDMRRTFAYKLYEQGVPVPEIQQLLGHASYETTIIYLGLDQNTVNTPALWENLL